MIIKEIRWVKWGIDIFFKKSARHQTNLNFTLNPNNFKIIKAEVLNKNLLKVNDAKLIGLNLAPELLIQHISKCKASVEFLNNMMDVY